MNNVEGGGRYRADNMQLLAKQRYDPKGLLNPGKMITFKPEEMHADEDLDSGRSQFRVSELEASGRAAARIDAAGASHGGDRAARPSSAAGH